MERSPVYIVDSMRLQVVVFIITGAVEVVVENFGRGVALCFFLDKDLLLGYTRENFVKKRRGEK